MAKKSNQLDVLHNYFTEELWLEYRHQWTGSHIHKYFPVGGNGRNVCLTADHGRSKKHVINSTELGKQLARTLHNDIQFYVYYKQRIEDLLSD